MERFLSSRTSSKRPIDLISEVVDLTNEEDLPLDEGSITTKASETSSSSSSSTIQFSTMITKKYDEISPLIQSATISDESGKEAPFKKPRTNAFTLLQQPKNPTRQEALHLHISRNQCIWFWSEESTSSTDPPPPQLPSWSRRLPFSYTKDQSDSCVLDLRFSSDFPLTVLRQSDESIRSFIPAFQSLLQKAVRRRMIRETERIAAEFFARDSFAAVRRAMIIILEDSVLHPAYPVLCWMFLALSQVKNGGDVFTPSDEILSLFAYIMGEVASSSLRDTAWSNEIATSSETDLRRSMEHTPVNIDHLSRECKSLIRSIRHRLRFGGFDSEKRMFSQSRELWIKRFSSSSCKSWIERIRNAHGNTYSTGSSGESILTYSRRLSSNFPGRLSISDAPLAGIDNHVISIMSSELRKALTLEEKSRLEKVSNHEISNDEIQDAIWLVNGNRNFRMFDLTANSDIPIDTKLPIHSQVHREIAEILSRPFQEFAIRILKRDGWK